MSDIDVQCVQWLLCVLVTTVGALVVNIVFSIRQVQYGVLWIIALCMYIARKFRGGN